MRRSLPWLLLAAVLVFVGYKLRTSHFDWAGFVRSWQTADLRLIGLAILVIYSNNVLRALRWSVFLRPAPGETALGSTPWYRLIGPQFEGFASLAIFGRIGELIRPLLIARVTRLPFASQIAVVAVERVFDLGAFALIFALNLLLSPTLQTLPFHERFHTVGLAIAALTLLVGIFVAGVRLAGTRIAQFAAGLFRHISEGAAANASEKILSFRSGLDVIHNVRDFMEAGALSLALWLTIAFSYVLVMKAFPAPVHSLTVADILLLMGFSVVGSVVQLPGVGGGAQVGAISALTLLFRIPGELAVSSGLILWLVTTMAVIPAGLLFARIEGVSLRQTAHGSEAEELRP